MTLRFPTAPLMSSRGTAQSHALRTGMLTEPAPLPGFCHGAMLDGLPDRHATSRHSCCELLGAVFGIESSSNAALRVRYHELMDICACLPASVPGHPAIQRKLEALRDEVAALKNKDIDPGERYEELDHLNLLNRRAARLYREIGAREWLMRQQQRSQALDMAVLPTAPRTPMPVSSDCASSAEEMRDEVAPALPHRRAVPRRRDLRPEVIEAPEARAVAAPRTFELDAAGLRALRQAIDSALEQANGLNRVSGRDMLVLGRSIVGLVNGRFTGRLPHPSDMRAHQYDIRTVVNTATNSMRSDQREAIRAAAERYLRHDQAGHQA